MSRGWLYLGGRCGHCHGICAPLFLQIVTSLVDSRVGWSPPMCGCCSGRPLKRQNRDRLRPGLQGGPESWLRHAALTPSKTAGSGLWALGWLSHPDGGWEGRCLHGGAPPTGGKASSTVGGLVPGRCPGPGPARKYFGIEKTDFNVKPLICKSWAG